MKVDSIDPPAEEAGLRYAVSTGHFINRYLEEKGVRNPIIYSSPCLNAIQTAAKIAK